MAEDQKDFQSRALPRIPLKLRINMEFEKFSGFISEYSENISEGGMFIKTTSPRQVGSVFSLEFKLKDDYKLIQGWGEVVWVRAKAENPAKPAGMGIKFLDLDEASRELIRNIIKIHKKGSGDGNANPFDFIGKAEDKDAQPAEKAQETDLSGLTKEVFGAEPSSLQPEKETQQVDDIFKDIKSEIDGEQPQTKPLANTAKTAPQTPPPKPQTAATDKAASTNMNFVKEVFGTDEPSKALASDGTHSQDPQGKTEKVKKIKVDESTNYRKVNWYADPYTIIFILIVVLIVAFGFLYHKKVIMSGQLVKNYLMDKNFPFVESIFGKQKADSRPIAKPVLTAIPSQGAVIATATPPPTTAVETPAPAAATVQEKPQPIEAKPNQEIVIKDILLKREPNGSMNVTFVTAAPVPKEAISAEFIPNPPRYLVKINGVKKPYQRQRFLVASPYLQNIRMALHQNPDSMHIVFDLKKKVVSKDVVLEIKDNNIIVRAGSKKTN